MRGANRLGLGLVLVLAACTQAVAQQGRGPRVLTVEQWRQDLRALVEHVHKEHRNPWAQISADDFDEAAPDLDARLASLTDSAVVVEMAALVARLGDGHSRLSLPVAQGEGQGRAHTATPAPAEGALLLRRYPLELYHFDDGLYVVGATDQHVDLIGSEVVGFGSRTTSAALEAVRRVANADNEMGHKLAGPRLLGIAELCEATGAAADAGRLALRVRDRAGQERDVVVAPLPADVVPKYVQAHERPGAPVPLWLKDRERAHWFQHLPEQRAVFAQINAIRDAPGQSMAQFASDLAAFVEANPVDRVVLDLRWNGGGNNYLNRSLVLALARSPKLRRFGALFTLTGRYTFSAAMNLASQLELWTGTLFAGEPTGSTPSHYGDARRFTLPNSGLSVRLSSIYWRDWNVNEKRTSIAPDLPVALSGRDYFDGRDPVLEAVVAFRAPERVAEQLLWVLDRGGLDAASRYLYVTRSDPATAGVDFFAELRQVGRTMLERGRPADALRVFQQNLRDRPDAFEAHADAGEAYLAAGKTAEAVTALAKALAIKPGDPRAQALLEKARAK